MHRRLLAAELKNAAKNPQRRSAGELCEPIWRVNTKYLIILSGAPRRGFNAGVYGRLSASLWGFYFIFFIFPRQTTFFFLSTLPSVAAVNLLKQSVAVNPTVIHHGVNLFIYFLIFILRSFSVCVCGCVCFTRRKKV